jgi:phosphoribosylformylglycinamidine cyclo-ligase
MAKILPEYRSKISAIFHNTGGGQTKCLNFGNNISYIKNNLFPLPPLFKLIEQKTNLIQREMYKTLNVGHRLELICEPEVSQEIIKISTGFGVAAQIIGHTKFREGETAVIIDTSTGTIEYKRGKD